MKHLTTVLFIIAFLFAAHHLHAQGIPKGGILFENKLTWDEIRAEAKAEHKYIFVDVYATWCQPCFLMDQFVYSNDTVGSFFAGGFISVKLQFDSTANDDGHTKGWYDVSHQFLKYGIEALPSFLFFDPNGNLTYQDEGYKSKDELMAMAKKALNPQAAGFFQRAKDFRLGKPDTALSSFGDLALYVRMVMKDKKLADTIAREYIAGYLDKLNKVSLVTEGNLVFIDEFVSLVTTRDAIFKLCFTEPDMVDAVAKDKNWASSLVWTVIQMQELRRKWLTGHRPDQHPDWGNIVSELKSKYTGVDIDRLTLDFEIEYYGTVGDWRQWAVCKNRRIKKYHGSNDIMELNDGGAWFAFKKVNDKVVLQTALGWINLLMDSAGNTEPSYSSYLDTKANLLYKLGRVKSAIQTEQEAIDLSLKRDRDNIAIIDANGRHKAVLYGVLGFEYILEQMKEGKPTYMNQGAVWDKRTMPKKRAI